MVLPKITAKLGYKNVTGHLVPTRGGSTGPVDIGRTHLVGAWTGKARFTMQAPPAKNAQVIMELGADGEIQHVSAAEEASKTEHEFYIICAALSVRSIMLATCSLTSCYIHSPCPCLRHVTACPYSAGERLPQPQGHSSTTFVSADVDQRATQVVLGDVPAGA